MKRSGFRRPERPERVPVHHAPIRQLALAAVPSAIVSKPKTEHHATGIRESARGEECLVRIPGVCRFDPACTIWSHYRGGAGGKGLGIKALDHAGAFACTACDAAYDSATGRPAGMTKEPVDLAWFEGHIRSLFRLKQKGLL